MKHSDVTGIPFNWLLGENATQDPPPLYFIVPATCSSVSVCFIDYDPSVGNMGTQTFRPIVSSHHILVRRFAPNSYLGKTFRPLHINKKDVSHQTIFQKDVSHPNHISERRFAPRPYFRKTFRTQTIFQKDVSHPNHISERCFAHKSYLGKTFRPLFILWKDVSPPNQKDVSPPMVIIWREVSHPFHN